MQDGNAKQQIVERIKGATNILVTVSSNPTVDELSAALGFTLMLNKMDKHATAVFSGQLPPAINFLEPDKTFESTVDSLRDFIIALDKEKADRLRYKVEDDVVRIFITPYRTNITDKDLMFSQGDFNVELIVALGVEKRDDLDKAIVAHGRILHDATVVTINSRNEKSSIGTIDWQDNNASSLCEMLMALSEALQPGLLDEQIATALLTGIVAATQRFSNQQTTPKVMTMAAQLMAAGANQQLIATKLEEKNVLPSRDGSTYLQEGASSRVSRDTPESEEQQVPAVVEQAQESSDGEIQVEHPLPEEAKQDNYEQPIKGGEQADEPTYDVERELTERLNAQLESNVPQAGGIGNLSEALAQEQQAEASSQNGPELPQPHADGAPQAPIVPGQVNVNVNATPGIIREKPAWMSSAAEPPMLGSALSATSQQALDDAVKQQERDRNHRLLSHDSPQESGSTQPEGNVSSNFGMQFEEAPLPSAGQPNSTEASSQESARPASSAPTLAELEAQAREAAASKLETPPHQGSFDVDQARQAVSEALNGTEFNPSNNPTQSIGAQPMLPIDGSDSQEVSRAQSPAADMPPLPPLPDFGALPPLPNDMQHDESPFVNPASPPNDVPSAQAPESSATPPQQGGNPGQFRIPGQ